MPSACTSLPFRYFAGLDVHRDLMAAHVYDAFQHWIGCRAACSPSNGEAAPIHRTDTGPIGQAPVWLGNVFLRLGQYHS